MISYLYNHIPPPLPVPTTFLVCWKQHLDIHSEVVVPLPEVTFVPPSACSPSSSAPSSPPFSSPSRSCPQPPLAPKLVLLLLPCYVIALAMLAVPTESSLLGGFFLFRRLPSGSTLFAGADARGLEKIVNPPKTTSSCLTKPTCPLPQPSPPSLFSPFPPTIPIPRLTDILLFASAALFCIVLPT